MLFVMSSFLTSIKRVNELFLMGNDGPNLLKAIHAIWDGDYAKADELLQSPEVLANSTATVLGGNDLAAILRTLYMPVKL